MAAIKRRTAADFFPRFSIATEPWKLLAESQVEPSDISVPVIQCNHIAPIHLPMTSPLSGSCLPTFRHEVLLHPPTPLIYVNHAVPPRVTQPTYRATDSDCGPRQVYCACVYREGEVK
jgi:hypothetical protein